MGQVSTIGLDLAKSIFQVHGADASGAVVVRNRLRRSQVRPFLAAQPPCTVAMEACGSAHYWAREIAMLGHAVRLIPPVLHVPAGVEVAVRLSTRDTTHAFWIPDVRYKRDAWPGVAQTFALTFPPGQHISGRCAQYCGLHHADMVFTVASLGRAEFAAWVARARGRRPGP